MYSSAELLVTSLERNDPGSSSTSPSRLPRILVENQPFSPSMRDFSPGAISVFMNVWPLLKSLPQIGRFMLRASSMQRRHVGGQVRRAVGVAHARFQRRVGVNLARRDLRIVLLQPALEILQRGVDRGRLVINLGGSAPDHGGARHAGALLELPDVVHDHLGMVHLGTLGLDVGPVDALHEVLVEDRLHRLDRRERRLHLLQQRGFQNARLHGRLVGVVLENVPAADLDVRHVGQRNEVLDRRAAALGPLPQADRSQLRERADRLPQSELERFQPGDESGGYRAHAGNQNTQLALGGRNLDAVFIGQIVLL